jgi:excisionase family DNA binding protein
MSADGDLSSLAGFYAARKKRESKPSPAEEFLSVDEAAKLLKVSRNSLYAAIERGELQGVKRIGRIIRIRKAALLESDGR